MLISNKYFNIPEYLLYKIKEKGELLSKVEDILEEAYEHYLKKDNIYPIVFEETGENTFNVGIKLISDYARNSETMFLHDLSFSSVVDGKIINFIIDNLNKFLNKRSWKKFVDRFPYGKKYLVGGTFLCAATTTCVSPSNATQIYY
jgi:hypothetical protein